MDINTERKSLKMTEVSKKKFVYRAKVAEKTQQLKSFGETLRVCLVWDKETT